MNRFGIPEERTPPVEGCFSGSHPLNGLCILSSLDSLMPRRRQTSERGRPEKGRRCSAEPEKDFCPETWRGALPCLERGSCFLFFLFFFSLFRIESPPLSFFDQVRANTAILRVPPV